MTKDDYIKAITNAWETTDRNRMGCNESWYNSYYAIKQTFTLDELNNMSLEEIEHLIRLGDTISEALY